MRKLFLGACLLVAAPLVHGAPADYGTNPSTVNVTVDSEYKELATGFARAFGRLRHVPFHVQLQRDGKNILINDIKVVTAESGVLLLETGKGLFYVVNPKDVIWFSDTPTVAGKPAAVETK